VNLKRVLEALAGLAMLKFFPANNEAVLAALARLCVNMCRSEDEVEWLVDRMTSGLYQEWPGPLEMRAVYCSRYKPKDGLNAYSQVYPDGIPMSKEGKLKQLAGAELKALPPGHVASADESMEVALRIAARTNSLTCPLGGPATAEEIAAAPRWLRRIEGYE
jgi:hypothetical protein